MSIPCDNETNDRAEPESDEGLMRRYRSSGDSQAFSELVRRYSPELTGYLRRIAGSAAADDLLQLTLLNVHQKRDSWDPQRRLRPWLYSIATHLAIDWLRQSGRHPTVSIERVSERQGSKGSPHALAEYLHGQPVSDDLAHTELSPAERAQQILLMLPDELRSAVLLVYLHQESYADAAETLGVPVGTVKSRVHRAIERLRHDVQAGHLPESSNQMETSPTIPGVRDQKRDQKES